MGRTGGLTSFRWHPPCWSSGRGPGGYVSSHAEVHLTVSHRHLTQRAEFPRWAPAWPPHRLLHWAPGSSCLLHPEWQCWAAPMSAWHIRSTTCPLPASAWHQDLTFSGGFTIFCSTPILTCTPTRSHPSFQSHFKCHSLEKLTFGFWCSLYRFRTLCQLFFQSPLTFLPNTDHNYNCTVI